MSESMVLPPDYDQYRDGVDMGLLLSAPPLVAERAGVSGAAVLVPITTGAITRIVAL